MRVCLYINEQWPGNHETAALPWVLYDPAGRVISQGVDPVGNIPGTGAFDVVVAASTAFLVRISLPTRQPQKLRQLLPFAVEEKIMCDPERVHVALGPVQADGNAHVVIVDKAWLQRVIEQLKQAGRPPRHVWLETLLPPWQPDTWTLVWRGAEGFVRTGESMGFLLDGGSVQASPQMLQLAIQQCKETERPAQVLLYVTQRESGPDLQQWSSQLGVPVHQAGAWSWADCPDGGEINLLQGEFAAASTEWLTRFQPTLILLALLMLLQGSAALADFARLKIEEIRLRHQMTALFQKAFPQVTTIADPAIQMQQNLATLRLQSGEPDPRDFTALVYHAGQVFAQLGTINVQRMQYEWGKLRFSAPVPDKQTANMVRGRLAGDGVDATVDFQPNTDGTGVGTYTMSVKK